MAKKKQDVQVENMTPEEERAYWDAHDPLRQGKKVRLRHLQPPEDRLSYFALRLSGKDIDRLAELAQSQGMKPSELARALILEGLNRASSRRGIEEQVAHLTKEIARVKKALAKLTRISKLQIGEGLVLVPGVGLTKELAMPRGNEPRFRW